MPGVITTCAECGAQYSWNSDYQEYPDCPKCGYNAMKIAQTKRDQCCSAASGGDLDGVKKALGDPGVRRNLNAGPMTILHHAVGGNQIEVVNYLLSEGAKPDVAYPPLNRTPLHIAASKGYCDIAKVLIDSGARVDAKDCNGEKPIDKSPDDTTRAFLQPYDSKMTLIIDFFAAVKAGEVEKVEEFLRVGVDPNEKDPSQDMAGVVRGIPALCHATGHKKRGKELTELLLRHGANPNTPRNAGITPLHDAAGNGRADIAALLIEHGAKVNARDENVYRTTPLHVACDLNGGHGQAKRVEVVKLLIEKGADINASDTEGRTPIDQAAMYIAVREKPEKKESCSEADFALLKVFFDAGGTLHPDEVGNPAIEAFLKSYAEQNPTSPQAMGPIRRMKPAKDASAGHSSPAADKKLKQGCFIATACYGSPACAEVLLLQDFRDRHLVQSGLGRAAIRLYYHLSPPMAAAISRRPYLRSLVRRILVAPAVRLVSAIPDGRSARKRA